MNGTAGTTDILSVLLVVFTLATIAAGVAVVVSAVFVLVGRARGTEAADTTDEVIRPEQLPLGAEAALNAIAELRPDPRNVVVTHRDPTGEVRLRPLGHTPSGGLQQTA